MATKLSGLPFIVHKNDKAIQDVDEHQEISSFERIDFTCYMVSVLYCLMASTKLNEYILSDECEATVINNIRSKNPTITEKEFKTLYNDTMYSHYVCILRNYWVDKKINIVPVKMCKKLYELSGTLCDGKFRDALQVYTYIIGELRSETEIKMPIKIGETEIELESKIDDIMRHYILDNKYCGNCGSKKSYVNKSILLTVSNMYNLDLNYIDQIYKPFKSLYDALDYAFFKPYTKFCCNVCGHYVINISKILKLPKILVIDINASEKLNEKILKYNEKLTSETDEEKIKEINENIKGLTITNSGLSNTKIITNDDFLQGTYNFAPLRETFSIPMELDMKKYMYDKSVNAEYSLYAISQLVHGNHYTALIKVNGKWYNCNDKIINEISNIAGEINYYNHNARILFYEKKI